MPTTRFSRVLLVEGDVEQRRLLSDVLEEDGFRVEACATAAECLARLRPGNFGVAIVDPDLPDMHGNALLGEILKADPAARVIVYTGTASYASAKEALNLGAFGYLEQTGDSSELLRHVHRGCTARVGRYAADLEAAVAQRTAELERSNQELQSFASVVAHDLRSPLLTISGYCEILLEDYGPQVKPAAQEYFDHILGAVQQMSRLIDDLLDYSRLGRTSEKHQAVAVGQVVRQAIEALDGSIRANRARIEAAELPTVSGNPTHLFQLFQNLVANAVKFRGKADPVVRISAQADGNCWQFAVADNGIGIERKDFDRIFQVFQRLHGKEYPGTGIGLALCKKIVERHGGRIWVESAPGSGTTFLFTLPAENGASG
jgi:signal transduction histidine kinase